MKMRVFSRMSVAIPAILAACVAGMSGVHADSVNDNRIIRKAGGVSEGELKNVEILFIYLSGFTESYQGYNHSGKVKIPKSEGDAKTKVKSTEPGEKGTNNIADGEVKKADVKRNGKLINYAGKGEIENDEFPDQPLMGTGKATGKVRGSKVVTSGDLKGNRNLGDEVTQKVSGFVRGKGRY